MISADRRTSKATRKLNCAGGIRAWLLVFLLLLVTGGLVCVAVVFKFRTDPKAARLIKGPMPVEAVKAKVTDIKITVGASGQALQHNTVNVTSRITSTAQKVSVEIGDIIENGKELLVADRRPFVAAVEAAEAHLSSTQNDVAKDQQDLDALKALHVKGLAAEVEVQQAQIALDTANSARSQAEKDLVNARLDLEFTLLNSPVNGIVLARFVNPNERFETNQVLMQLGDLDKVYFLANVQEEMVGQISSGQPAEVVFPSYPSTTFTGTVEHIDPRTDPKTRTFTAYITLPNEGLQLKPGISGFARIHLDKMALAVPSTAIMNIVGESPSVFVINQELQAVSRPVRLGIEGGGLTEILGGVREGEMVVSVGSLYLKDGDKVNMTLSELGQVKK
jgi:RND family efflux transporter MFP subunit